MELRESVSTVAASMAAAHWIAQLIHEAVEVRGMCTLALSGGRTPQHMLRALAAMNLPWHALHVFQIDERAVSRANPARNLSQLDRLLLRKVAIPPHQIHPMPVEQPSLHRAAADYSKTLAAIAGKPVVLDIVHLGLGVDGHTASLVPGDPVLEESAHDVAVTQMYAGYQRMTLTFPCLTRSRNRVWLITGANKSAALAQLVQQDAGLPASRLARYNGRYFVDRSAAVRLPHAARQGISSDQ